MDFREFEDSVAAGDLPEGLPAPLRALWIDRAGDPERAHEIVQHESGPAAAWVHAYLHRCEGDLPNARYWYRRAGREPADEPIASEWGAIVRQLLEDGA